jgi:hypothetical protein
MTNEKGKQEKGKSSLFFSSLPYWKLVISWCFAEIYFEGIFLLVDR